MFNRSQNNSNDYVTREEAAAVVDQVTSLNSRVTELEALARRLGASPVSVGEARPVVSASSPSFDRSGIPAAAQGEDAPAGRVATAARTGVDYGAVAFGLAEIARKTSAALSALGGAPELQLRSEYEGAVQYFADVFAKSDPSFDAAEFKRQAGA